MSIQYNGKKLSTNNLSVSVIAEKLTIYVWLIYQTIFVLLLAYQIMSEAEANGKYLKCHN